MAVIVREEGAIDTTNVVGTLASNDRNSVVVVTGGENLRANTAYAVIDRVYQAYLGIYVSGSRFCEAAADMEEDVPYNLCPFVTD